MAISKTISCAGTDLHIFDEDIGVCVSGGLDSAILLYYLMKHTKSTIHIYSQGFNAKRRRNTIIAPQVVEKCIQLTDNINIVQHIDYKDVGTWSSIAEAPIVALEQNLIKRLVIGVTMNPPDDVANSFTPELDFDSRRKTTGDNDLFVNSDTIYYPWANIDKRDIAKMYKEEDLMNSLFPVTRSCEYDPTCDYFDNIEDPNLGHCGECWWCKEREWGFK